MKEQNKNLKGVYSKPNSLRYSSYVKNIDGKYEFVGSFKDPVDAYKAVYYEHIRIHNEEIFDFDEIKKTTLKKIEKTNKQNKSKTYRKILEKKYRKCLKCDKNFLSASNENRLCKHCRESIKFNNHIIYKHIDK
jgi:hypothetical protein